MSNIIRKAFDNRKAGKQARKIQAEVGTRVMQTIGKQELNGECRDPIEAMRNPSFVVSLSLLMIDYVSNILGKNSHNIPQNTIEELRSREYREKFFFPKFFGATIEKPRIFFEKDDTAFLFVRELFQKDSDKAMRLLTRIFKLGKADGDYHGNSLFRESEKLSIKPLADDIIKRCESENLYVFLNDKFIGNASDDLLRRSPSGELYYNNIKMKNGGEGMHVSDFSS